MNWLLFLGTALIGLILIFGWIAGATKRETPQNTNERMRKALEKGPSLVPPRRTPLVELEITPAQVAMLRRFSDPDLAVDVPRWDAETEEDWLCRTASIRRSRGAQLLKKRGR